ncbi:hypothetical protein PUNSTDRAFT_138423 [Punctularia strigosozonata HHB-11173 SS5]|uniref:Uncharacterized protein n=1 Tax=Punctularia strigosozonata (strain HHB-11173) TaxID=741275 RepID=R7S3K4_PUNST|nr:uncharacterized protein PUNSTDRAFT_138423 [Punctularia strigosozonata HHB-11173 SS5]EIN04778.1 hypothetical protein PUNSTDRAFT_138423 [Punctularia strigosozonata HHB-11173 SS5]
MPPHRDVSLASVCFVDVAQTPASHLPLHFESLNLYGQTAKLLKGRMIADVIGGVDSLTMCIMDWQDYHLWRALSEPGKGVVHLELEVLWTLSKEERDVLCYSDKAWNTGMKLQELTLCSSRGYAKHSGRTADGCWASHLLLTIQTQELALITLRVFPADDPGIWDRFDWAAVDDAVTSKDRFPALEELVIDMVLPRARIAESSLYEERVNRLLPKALKQNLLIIEGREDDWPAIEDPSAMQL